MAGRAYALYGYTDANGSRQSMGLWNIYAMTTLKQTGTNYDVIGTCRVCCGVFSQCPAPGRRAVG